MDYHFHLGINRKWGSICRMNLLFFSSFIYVISYFCQCWELYLLGSKKKMRFKNESHLVIINYSELETLISTKYVLRHIWRHFQIKYYTTCLQKLCFAKNVSAIKHAMESGSKKFRFVLSGTFDVKCIKMYQTTEGSPTSSSIFFPLVNKQR